ncbi:MAG: aspartate kinase, partial [Candidatus Hadarchaeales archaeon]
MRIVVKFGGTSVGTLTRIKKDAEAVYREFRKGTQVAVVVSAMGHTTDALIKTAKTVGEKLGPKEMDFIMALGERASARIFAAALREIGAKAKAIDPMSEEWPVVTDSNHGLADIDLKATMELAKKKIVSLLEDGVIPVICGFLGKDRKGNITTIGRGGSDITGFLIGKCIGADEVIIVTDVDGVMSADPNVVEGAKILEKITVEEMTDLARFGAQVMHPRAMRYKDPEIDAKVINFKHYDLSAPGTKIIGPVEKEVEGVRLVEEPLAMLTVVGEEMQVTPGVLVKTSTPVSAAGINIFGVSIGPRSFSLYVRESEAEKAAKLVHEVIVGDRLMKSVTTQGGLAMIVAESEKFIYTPGVIARLTAPLAKEKINIVEILSSRASISFFVNWEDRERAMELFKKAMKD